MGHGEWNLEIVEVAEAFAHARAGDDGACLIALHSALTAAPREVSAALGPLCARDRAHALADDCPHELAFALAGRAGLMVSRPPEGAAQATMIAAGLFGETSCTAASLPLAIGGALAAGLVEWAASARVPVASRATH